MELIRKLFEGNGNSENSNKKKKVRLAKNKKVLTQFLSKVGRKYQKPENKKYSPEELIDGAGKIIYHALEIQHPRYMEVTGKPNPRLITEKKKRDDVICDTAEHFVNFLDFILAHQGMDEMDYGVLDRNLPAGKLKDMVEGDKNEIEKYKYILGTKFDLPPGPDLDKAFNDSSNYSIRNGCIELNGHIDAFVGYIGNSGIVKDILNTPKQIRALEDFYTGVCNQISLAVQSLQKQHELREKINQSCARLSQDEIKGRESHKKSLRNFKEGLKDLSKDYNKQFHDLILMGIDESNISQKARENASEIAEFVAETGKYETSKVRQENENRKKQREKRKREYETTMFLPDNSHPHNVTPRTGIYAGNIKTTKTGNKYKDEVGEYIQTKRFKKNGNGSQSNGSDSSDDSGKTRRYDPKMWGNRK